MKIKNWIERKHDYNKNTENLTGVTISGDYYDLWSLIEAFHDITIDEYSSCCKNPTADDSKEDDT